MCTPQAIGFVDSPSKDTAAIPKGLGAKHNAEGILRILPEFEVGLTDIEGFIASTIIAARKRCIGTVETGSGPAFGQPSQPPLRYGRSGQGYSQLLEGDLCGLAQWKHPRERMLLILCGAAGL